MAKFEVSLFSSNRDPLDNSKENRARLGEPVVLSGPDPEATAAAFASLKLSDWIAAGLIPSKHWIITNDFIPIRPNAIGPTTPELVEQTGPDAWLYGINIVHDPALDVCYSLATMVVELKALA